MAEPFAAWFAFGGTPDAYLRDRDTGEMLALTGVTVADVDGNQIDDLLDANGEATTNVSSDAYGELRFSAHYPAVTVAGPSGLPYTLIAANATYQVVNAYLTGALASGGGGGGTLTLPANLAQWSTDGAAPPKGHSHKNVDLSEATTVGKAVLSAKDENTARQAIKALPDSFTGLQLGDKGDSGKAMRANETFKASEIGFTPTGALTATSVDQAILQASQTGSSNGGVTGVTLDVIWQSGSYPTQPASAPAGIKIRHFWGPQAYVGATWAGVVDAFTAVAIP